MGFAACDVVGRFVAFVALRPRRADCATSQCSGKAANYAWKRTSEGTAIDKERVQADATAAHWYEGNENRAGDERWVDRRSKRAPAAIRRARRRNGANLIRTVARSQTAMPGPCAFSSAAARYPGALEEAVAGERVAGMAVPETSAVCSRASPYQERSRIRCRPNRSVTSCGDIAAPSARVDAREPRTSGQILLVREDEQQAVLHLAVLQDPMQLLLRLVDPLLVLAVDDEDEALRAGVVVPPQWPDLVLPSDVPARSATERPRQSADLLKSATASSDTIIAPDVEFDVLVLHKVSWCYRAARCGPSLSRRCCKVSVKQPAQDAQADCRDRRHRLIKLELVEDRCALRHRSILASAALVLPAASSPSIRMRISLLPKSLPAPASAERSLPPAPTHRALSTASRP